MSDPLAQPPEDRSPLFAPQNPEVPPVGGTRAAAGLVAAEKSGSRRRRILEIIERQPSTLFEIAAILGVPDHTISGRISELKHEQFIEPSGEHRIKPESGCPCEVYQLKRALPANETGWAELLGYPARAMIHGEPHDRQDEPDRPGVGYPGVHYAACTDHGAMRRSVRVELVESPCCGKPLFVEDVPATAVNSRGLAVPASKRVRCSNPACLKAYRIRPVNEAGKAPMLALVMEEF